MQPNRRVIVNATRGERNPRVVNATETLMSNVPVDATQPKVDQQCQRNKEGVSMNAIQGLSVPTKR